MSNGRRVVVRRQSSSAAVLPPPVLVPAAAACGGKPMAGSGVPLRAPKQVSPTLKTVGKVIMGIGMALFYAAAFIVGFWMVVINIISWLIFRYKVFQFRRLL